ncbi:MAG: hypothetical protein L3J02_04120, partial [Henriciella sp.]|nr:hypothetical protein [Henriciella sp.]
IAAILFTAAMPASATPCSLDTSEDAPACSTISQQKIIKLSDIETTKGVTIYRPYSGATSPAAADGVRIFKPYDAAYASDCRRSIRRVPDYGRNAIRYAVGLRDIEAEDGLDVEQAYARIKRTARRVCRLNGATSADARKFCLRDTLYRAILDAQRPTLTAYFTTQTRRYTPRVEVDPAKTY